jgi:hypothetical protein
VLVRTFVGWHISEVGEYVIALLVTDSLLLSQFEIVSYFRFILSQLFYILIVYLFDVVDVNIFFYKFS